jgi:hypothetical protein
VGTISSGGLYTAPADLPTPAAVTVTAASQADSTKSAQASVAVTSDIIVTITTNPATLPAIQAGITVPLTVTIGSAGRPDETVEWFVNNVANGNSSVGTVAGTGLNALYTAPATVTTATNVTIQATSVADPSKSTTLTISLSTLANSLSGAFNFAGPYPAPALVTYTDNAANTLSVLAFPGQISLSVSPSQINAAGVAQLASDNNGTVIAQIPGAGLYWIQVTPGSEGAFITAMFANSAVLDAAPNIPQVATQSSSVVDLSNATSTVPILLGTNRVAKFDFFQNSQPVCNGSHGAAVDAILNLNGVTASEFDISQPNPMTMLNVNGQMVTLGSESDWLTGVGRAAEGAFQEGHRLVINLSLGSAAIPDDALDRGDCEGAPASFDHCSITNGGTYASWKAAEGGLLGLVAQELQNMRPELLDNTLVVISSGNAGLNLTNEILAIQSKYPNGFAHMIIAGGMDQSGQPSHNFDFSNTPTTPPDPTQIVYAPATDVTIPGTGGCTATGTSFAAPAISNLAAQLAYQFPTLTTDQIRTALLSNPQTNGLFTIPTPQQATNAAQGLQSPPSSGNYAGTCTATGTPVTCCADGTCVTVPAPSPSTSPINFTLAPGTSLSQFTSEACNEIYAGLSASGCAGPSCSYTVGTSSSASFSLSCTVAASSGCTAETVTETCSMSLQ